MVPNGGRHAQSFTKSLTHRITLPNIHLRDPRALATTLSPSSPSDPTRHPRILLPSTSRRCRFTAPIEARRPLEPS